MAMQAANGRGRRVDLAAQANPQPRIPEATVQAAYPSARLSFAGSGGQSDVWKAQLNGRDEALRILIGGHAPRLAQEVTALQSLSSPHLMNFYALETLRHQGVDYPVVRGEFISGTVADQLAAGTRPGAKRALECAAGVLEALRVLHDADLIHRDVKPENIALRNGVWQDSVLLDLGLLRAITATTVTVYPTHIGTLPFMAPEQLRQEQAKVRSDVFGVGVVLFLLLVGEHPFLRVGETVQLSDLLDRIEDHDWPDQLQLSPMDPGVRGLVERMLAYAPHQRPSVTAALADLRRLVPTL